MPRASRMSCAASTGVAPSRSSVLEPVQASVSIGPGTTPTSRPCSRLWRAVHSVPLAARASTTRVNRARPLIRRLRSGKCAAYAGVPGGCSESHAPFEARMRRARPRLPTGEGSSRPDARTATVAPPPSSAPLWAAASMP